jgi:hypothetical protein
MILAITEFWQGVLSLLGFQVLISIGFIIWALIDSNNYQYPHNNED